MPAGTTIVERLLQRTVSHYLESDEFKGLDSLVIDSRRDDSVAEAVETLVESSRLHAIFDETDPNPAIKRFRVDSTEVQIARIRERTKRYCLYPTPEELRKFVSEGDYPGRPYTFAMAAGAFQLEPKFFDLSILEFYRNDPRYMYDCNDVHGMISISDEFYVDGTPESDLVLLQDFGFGFSDVSGRAVAVFVCDLAALSREHQGVWKAREKLGAHELHPDFMRSALYAEFPTHIPISDAFFMEMRVINEMCDAMSRPRILKFVPKSVPRKFGFLLRPTQQEFDDFVLTLDKLMSDNISKDFFRDDVPTESETVCKDGKTIVSPRGTIAILEDWMSTKIRFPDPESMKVMLSTLRDVRKRRQNPAHVVGADVFDHSIALEQRKLLIAAYHAIRTLRLILGNHPACAGIQIHESLFEGRIRDY